MAVLAEEVGVTKVTIYGWLQGARKRALLAATESLGGRQVTSRKGRERSPSEKLRLVNASESLKGEALAAFVRDNVTTVAELMTWRDLMLGGLERREDEAKVVSAERYDEVLKELERKNAALAEAASSSPRAPYARSLTSSTWSSQNDQKNDSVSSSARA